MMLESFAASLGEDLSDVRLMFDAPARELCGALACDAVTAGSTVYFATRPATPADPAFRLLLAHELVHVIQNRRRPARPALLGAPGDDAELEARELATRMVAGSRVTVRCAPGGLLQRAAAAPAWPTAIKSMDELKMHMAAEAYSKSRALMQVLGASDRATLAQCLDDVYRTDQTAFKRLVSLVQGAPEADRSLLIRIIRELKALPDQQDLPLFAERLDGMNAGPWLKEMIKAANALPVSDTDKAKLWLAVARGQWHAPRAAKEYQKVAKVKQGTPVLDASGFIAYWDFLSRYRCDVSNPAQYSTSVVVPIPGGQVTVSIPGHKVAHFLEGHTFKFFKRTKGNFTRSSTHMMSFWPVAKTIQQIVNDARTALLNNADVGPALALPVAQWPLNREGTGIDVDHPYSLHLGFYRTGEATFNLTQFYPNEDTVGGANAIILHEEMVIAIFSVLLPLE
jgi:hypothetical protein